jgi:ribosomal protein S2
MYKTFYKFNILNLIKLRLHLGHKNENLNLKLTGYLYGTRHQINIYNLDFLWKPYRYLFYSLTCNFAKRNCFFIIGTNKNLPMTSLLKNLLEKYPFNIHQNPNQSFYISGYIDRKWIGGLFSNWKIFNEFIFFIERPFFKFNKKFKFQKYFPYLQGIINLPKMPIPDFFIFLDQNCEAEFELKKFKIPFLGLVDTNMDPNIFLYKFFGNNDSIENIQFFFKFLIETLKEGRLKEQSQFYRFFIKKIKKNLYKKRKVFWSKIKQKEEAIKKMKKFFKRRLAFKNKYQNK